MTSTEYYLGGHGWRVGPMTDETKAAMLGRVIKMLEWARKTARKGGDA